MCRVTRGAPTGGARAAAASRQAHSDDADAGGDWRQPAAEATLAALQDILGSPGPKEITAAVRAQLEQGDVVRTPVCRMQHAPRFCAPS